MLCFLMLAACKKEAGEKGYTFTTAYKNSLNIPVEIEFGYLSVTNENERSIRYAGQKISITAGKSHEIPEFICTENCKPVNLIHILAPVSVKFIMNGKEKVDTACGFFFANDELSRTRCEQDAISFYNNSRWKEEKDKAGKIIRKEYVIDSDDLAEAK